MAGAGSRAQRHGGSGRTRGAALSPAPRGLRRPQRRPWAGARPAAPGVHRGATREAPLTSRPRHWAEALLRHELALLSQWPTVATPGHWLQRRRAPPPQPDGAIKAAPAPPPRL